MQPPPPPRCPPPQGRPSPAAAPTGGVSSAAVQGRPARPGGRGAPAQTSAFPPHAPTGGLTAPFCLPALTHAPQGHRTRPEVSGSAATPQSVPPETESRPTAPASPPPPPRPHPWPNLPHRHTSPVCSLPRRLPAGLCAHCVPPAAPPQTCAPWARILHFSHFSASSHLRVPTPDPRPPTTATHPPTGRGPGPLRPRRPAGLTPSPRATAASAHPAGGPWAPGPWATAPAQP